VANRVWGSGRVSWVGEISGANRSLRVTERFGIEKRFGVMGGLGVRERFGVRAKGNEESWSTDFGVQGAGCRIQGLGFRV